MLNKLKTFIRQCFCKHDYKPWANIYGDLINTFDGDRTVFLCKKCKKHIFSKEYVEAPLNYNAILELASTSIFGNSIISIDDSKLDNVVKNKELFEDFYIK